MLPQRAGVLILVGSFGQLCKSGLLGKGERRAVRGDLECRRGFPTVGKGVKGLAGGGREHGRNIQLVEGAFVKFLRYWACRNQVGDRKEDCIWLEEIKGWEGSGKLCSLRISVCLDGDLFLPPVFPFRNHLFFFPHVPAAEYLLGPVDLLSPSSHNDALLSKKPCSPPASFCNSPYSPTCSPAPVLHDWRGEAGKAAPDQVALEILVVRWAFLLPYYLVKEWRAFPHTPDPLSKAAAHTAKCISYRGRPCRGQLFCQWAFHKGQGSAAELQYLRLACPKVHIQIILKC